jgi:hypothetical protein
LRLVLAVLLAAGCLPAKKEAVLPPTAAFPLMSFSQALAKIPAPQGARVRVIYLGKEDSILDLPDDYAEEWHRFAVADPENPKKINKDVVAPQTMTGRLAALKKGDRLELRVARMPWDADSAAFSEGDRAPLWRVQSLRADNGQIETAFGTYRTEADPDAFVRLSPGGKLEMRAKGRTVGGTYQIEGTTLIFNLDSGVTAKGSLSDGLLTDPSGARFNKE